MASTRCCVPDCPSSLETAAKLFPFVVPQTKTANVEQDSSLARTRYRRWVRTLQVAPSDTRPEVWICHRHFASGRPAELDDIDDVDWIPTLNLGGIPANPCRECLIVLQKLPAVDVCVPNLEVAFCRLCLAQSVPHQAMFLATSAGQRLARLIEKFASIKVDLERDSDGVICFDCLENLAQMEKMERIKARWNAKNELLETLRRNNNQEETAIKEDRPVEDEEMGPVPVVSIPMDSLIDSIFEPTPMEESIPVDYKDFKEDLEQLPADVSQDCILLEPSLPEVIDLTDIEERERLILIAIRSLRKQMRPKKRKRSKSETDKPSKRKPCRNTRIG